jgi:hypothetical protein
LDSVSYISGSSGSIIEGFSFLAYSASISGFSGIHDIIIRRNKFMGSNGSISMTPATNIVIINNILERTYVSNSTNVLIYNNIISGYIMGATPTTIISNNVFINITPFSGCQSVTVTNNIFYYGSTNGMSYGNFSNNMAFGLTTGVVTGTNSGSNNITADPQFLYLYSTTDHNYNDQNKYKLKSSSQGKNAGTDGKDIGIYGGQYPWPASVLTDYIHCIPPAIPMMQELNIQNSSVPANGTLNFSVKAYKSSK